MTPVIVFVFGLLIACFVAATAIAFSRSPDNAIIPCIIGILLSLFTVLKTLYPG